MDDKLLLRAYACAVTEENQFAFSHEATVGTGYISIEYNHMDSPSGDNFLSDNSFAAGEIEVWSDGFSACSIFCEDAAPRIVEDFEKISGYSERPTKVFWESPVLDASRWHRIKEFIEENDLELRYSEEEAVEREIELGSQQEKNSRNLRRTKKRKMQQRAQVASARQKNATDKK